MTTHYDHIDRSKMLCLKALFVAILTTALLSSSPKDCMGSFPTPHPRTTPTVSTNTTAIVVTDTAVHSTKHVHSDNTTTTTTSNVQEQWMHSLEHKTPLSIPLQPPFRIVQVSRPRTGSTFQFHLLDAMAQLKSRQSNYDVHFQGFVGNDDNPLVSTAYTMYGPSFVAKSHDRWDNGLGPLQQQGSLVIFTSGLLKTDALYNISLYNQDRDKLQACSLCEIDHYRTLFGLTDDDVAALREYMALYQRIRQCCGLQMSHYEIARLNGCPITANMRARSDYPHCETMDKAAVEAALAAQPIPHRTNDPDYNWAAPGDCAKFDAIIASGKGFNGKHAFDVEYDCPM